MEPYIYNYTCQTVKPSTTDFSNYIYGAAKKVDWLTHQGGDLS